MNDTIPIYLGFDPREAIGTYVFMNSVIRHSSKPVSFHPLALTNLHEYDDSTNDGTNQFIKSRFLIPWLNGYRGWAIFCDGADQMLRDDVAKLWDLRDWHRTALMVVPHTYKTQYKRKYIGTSMEADNHDYPKKNQSSVMLINCGHSAWQKVTPEYVNKSNGSHLHRFEFLPPESIKSLPHEWNHLVGEQPYNEQAKLVHWTLGVPGMTAYKHTHYADEWFEELALTEYIVPSGE